MSKVERPAWLNSLPPHWGIERGKTMTSLVQRPTSKEDGIVTAFRDGTVTLRANRRTDGFTEAIHEIGYQGVREGELVIHSMDGFAGAIGVSDSSGKMSPVVHIYRTPNDNPFYIAYALRSAARSGIIQSLAKGIRERSTSFDKASFKALHLPRPPRDEQDRIVAYLDRETSKIEELTSEQRRLIEMFNERIYSLNDHYFGGVNKKRRVLLKHILRKLDRPAVSGLGVVTSYRDGVVTLRSNRREDGYTFSEKEGGYQEVRPGDLVFHGLDGFSGAVGISDSHGNGTPVYHVCETISDDDPEYVALLLRHLGTSGFLATQAPSVRQRAVDFRNWSTFARIPLALPGFPEQRSVVRNIREQVARIDTLIAESEKLIELSRERRSALITAAVTGQIDIPQEV